MGAEPSAREAIDHAMQIITSALDRLEHQKPDYSAEIVMRTVKPVLELGCRAFARADDRRRAKAALAMVCAELGIDP